MSSNENRKKLESCMFSEFPILKIETDEEIRVLGSIKQTASKVGKSFITWSIASGINEDGTAHHRYKNLSLQPVDEYDLSTDDSSSNKEVEDPEKGLEYIKNNVEHAVVVLLDFHPYFSKTRVVRQLKELAHDSSKSGNKYILLSHSITIPAELAKLSDEFTIDLPTRQEISDLIDCEIVLFSIKRKNKHLKIDETAKTLLINNLVGLSYSDVERLVKNAIYVDEAITQSDVPEIRKAKYRLISNEGALTFEYDTASFDEIGGFKILKQWINKRRNAIVEANAAEAANNDRPKGVLLLGVQGCGKSLAARAIAGQLGIPLIRLDFGALYNKYIGESERNVREALKSAKVMSPCVLWVDEIEKGISGQDDNSGTSGRILATLLSWMQENQSGTFVVATANDITSLPPELIRKGRLDEIFFVDLPQSQSRAAIFQSVLRKRGLPHAQFDIPLLCASSEGFSGAEIEQAVVSAMYHDFGAKHVVSTDDVLMELHATQPLSIVRHEEIQQLRHWASSRTVSVDEISDTNASRLRKLA